MAKNLGYGTKIASKQTKDGCFRNVTPRKETNGSPNPYKAKPKMGMGK